jgi:hypothetical protein
MTTSSKINITLKDKFYQNIAYGLNLSGSQVDFIWQFIEQAILQAQNSKVEEIERKLKNYVWDRDLGNSDELVSIMENRKRLNEFVLHQPKENKK